MRIHYKADWAWESSFGGPAYQKMPGVFLSSLSNTVLMSSPIYLELTIHYVETSHRVTITSIARARPRSVWCRCNDAEATLASAFGSLGFVAEVVQKRIPPSRMLIGESRMLVAMRINVRRSSTTFGRTCLIILRKWVNGHVSVSRHEVSDYWADSVRSAGGDSCLAQFVAVTQIANS